MVPELQGARDAGPTDSEHQMDITVTTTRADRQRSGCAIDCSNPNQA